MKEMADDRRNVKKCDLAVGDTVMVKQEKRDKLSTPFNPTLLKVTARKGSMMTAEDSHRRVTRNSSHFKKISSRCSEQYVEPLQTDLEEIPLECPEDAGENQENTENLVQIPLKKLPVRNRRMPSHLNDFILQLS